MYDLISRDALIRDISEKIDISKAERAAAIKHGRYNDAYFYSGEICIARRIRRYANMFVLAVDAVEVVRCKECAEWRHGLCRLLCADTEEDGYCYWAQRRAEEVQHEID